MVDCSIYGLNPAGHHLTSLLLHICNSLILFGLLRRMTAALWRSAFLAALFAWHPLHVESVAWAAERKDVLSTLFFLLTLCAYAKYAQYVQREAKDQGPGSNRPGSPIWYRIALVLFALGLMCKPMLVTLPFVLLLLDFWPLRRLIESPHTIRAALTPLARLTCEKLPFFALSAASSVITYLVQHDGGAVSGLSTVPITLRVANALLAYCRYIGKTIWPANLVAIYPLPDHIPPLAPMVAALGLAAVCGYVLLRRRVQPYLVTGWFWYLGTLVPAIGLVQVGAQAIADRYTYIPSIGLFLVVTWGATDFLAACRIQASGNPNFKSALNSLKVSSRFDVWAIIGSLSLLSCMLCTWFQTRYWHDGETLHRHTLKVDPSNYVGYEHLGIALAESGRLDEAICFVSQSARLSPSYAEAHYNLGTMLLQQGRLEEALASLKTAVKLSPTDANAHHNLGNVYLRLKQLPEATAELASAAALKPEDAPVRLVLGDVLLSRNMLDEAAILFSEVLRLEPNNLEGHRDLGVAFARQGKLNEAIRQFAEAVRLDPTRPELRFNLGLALLDAGRSDEATIQFQEILLRNPNDTSTHYRLATALMRQHDSKGAVAHFREAVRLSPEFSDALTELAWILATAPDSELRAGEEAVQLARQACNLTEYKQPRTVAALAAAYAETARFPDAVATAKRARDLAVAGGQQDVIATAESLLKVSEAGHPFRQVL